MKEDPTATPRVVSLRRRMATRAVVADAAMLALAAAGVQLVAQSQPADAALWAVGYCLVTLLVLRLRGAYRVRLQGTAIDELGRIFAAAATAATIVIATRLVVAPHLEAPRQTVWLFAVATVSLGAGRAGLALARRHRFRHGEAGLSTLIVGAGSVGSLVARRLQQRPELGFHPIGFLDKEPLSRELPERELLPTLGASWDLEAVVAAHRVRHVIVTFSTAPHHVLIDIMRRCQALGVEVSVVPRLFETVTQRVTVDHLGGIALLRAEESDPQGWQYRAKYALDKLVAIPLLIALSPLLTVLALGVRLSSPGPILYRQPRVGLDGREFEMLKFRTMTGSVEDAGEWDAAWAADQTAGDAIEPQSDERRTAFGVLLRRWSLDELPQLLNVAKGDMSLVGPRPERTSYVQTFEQDIYRYSDRHRVKSGITGWAQVNGLRGQTSLADRVEWDNWYIENWTLRLDLKIILRTVPALLRPHDYRALVREEEQPPAVLVASAEPASEDQRADAMKPARRAHS